MKDVMEVAGLTVELVPDGDPNAPTGPRSWPLSAPRAGDLLEHEGKDYVVTQVRWSVDDPRHVEVRLRSA